MYKLFERAKPDDADLLFEIQRIHPAIHVPMDAILQPVLSLLLRRVVDWLQVSPVFMSTQTQIIQLKITMSLQPAPKNATIHHKKQYHFGTVMFRHMTRIKMMTSMMT